MTVDTSVAHLAGALGKAMYVALCFTSSWQWLLDREDSPWYPSATLFRQSEKGEWSPVIEEIIQSLEKRFVQASRTSTEELTETNANTTVSQHPPDFFESGNQFMREKRYIEAVDAFQRALGTKEDFPEAHLNLGNAYFAQQKYEEAVFAYNHVIRLWQDRHEGYFNLGNTLCKLERAEEAIPLYQKALEHSPTSSSIVLALATAYQQIKRIDEAVVWYKKTLELDATIGLAHERLGEIYKQKECYHDARYAFDEVLKTQPQRADILVHLGDTLSELKEFENALSAYQRALQIQPEFSAALNNMGNLLLKMDQPERAIQTYQKILAFEPENVHALNNLGNAYTHIRDVKKAFECFERAVALHPENTNARWNLGIWQIINGNFLQGFEGHEWRLKSSQKPARTFPPKERWNGEDLTEKSIFVYLEQGNGDCIHFVRYVTLLAKISKRVFLESRKPLDRLFRTIPNVEVVPEKTDLPTFDVYTSVMSLPYHFKTTIDTIPLEIPYVHSPSPIPPKLLLGCSNVPRIGLVWKGNPAQGNDRNRSSKLADLLELTKIPGLAFYCLQKDLTKEERDVLASHKHIDLISDRANDFFDTAALIDQMNLVISIDTSVAHLAGALGKPVWVTACFNSAWQWMLEGERSPWYPSARVFRQRSLGDWKGVFHEVAIALQKQFDLPFSTVPETEEPPLAIAKAQIESGNVTDSLTICSLVPPTSEDFPEAQFLLSQISVARNDLPLALQQIEQSLNIKPAHTEYLALKGKILCKLDCRDEAQQLFEQVLLSDHQHLESMISLAEIKLANAKPHEVLELLNRHLTEECTTATMPLFVLAARAYQLLGDTVQSRFFCNEILKVDNNHVDALQILALLSIEDPQKKIELLVRCKALAPLSSEVRIHLAQAYNFIENKHQAIKEYQEAIELAPQHIEAHLALSQLYLNQSQLREAIDTLYDVLMVAPDCVEAHWIIAQAYTALEQPELARLSYQQIRLIEPTNTHAHDALNNIWKTPSHSRVFGKTTNHSEEHALANAILSDREFAPSSYALREIPQLGDEWHKLLCTELGLADLCLARHQGSANRIFSAKSLNGNDCIVKIYRSSGTKDCEVSNIEKVQQAHNDLARSVPQVISHGALDYAGTSYSYLVTEKIPGTPLLHLPVESHSTIWEQTGALLRLIHESIPVSGNSSENFYRESVTRFIDDITSATALDLYLRHSILDRNSQDKVVEILHDLHYMQKTKPCFCHLDLNPGNILWSASTLQVWFTDWEHSGESHLVGRYRDFVSWTAEQNTILSQSAFRRGYGLDRDNLMNEETLRMLFAFQLGLFLFHAQCLANSAETHDFSRVQQSIGSLLKKGTLL